MAIMLLVVDSGVSELEARLAAVGTAPEDAQARVDALVDLAWAIRFSERERSKQLATEARELSISIGDKRGQAWAARTLCMTTASTDTLRDVMALAEEAKTLFDEVGDQRGRAGARDFLAGIHEFLGDGSVGLDLAFEALSIAQEIDDPVRQGYALCNVGGILTATGDVAAGIARWREALDLFGSVGDAHGIGRICERLSEFYREQGNLDEALVYARRLLDTAERAGDDANRATALAALGELEQEQEHYRAAERLFRESISAHPNDEIRALGGIPARLSLGRLLARRGALAEAEAEVMQGIDAMIAYGVATPAYEANARQILADVSQQQGDLQKANEQLSAVARLREQAAEDKTRSKLARFEARAEAKAAKQEAEIHRLKFVELTQVQSKLVEAEKMAQLGTFAAGTAHELNSPLGVLRSNLSLYARAAERLSELAAVEHPDAARTRKLASALSTCQRSSEDERVHLFDVGWSADRTRTKMRLGLAAAHAAIQRHDGQVEVQSAPGKGTTFVFSFPAHRGSDPSAPEG
jgi:signal transduction histidine kinase